MEFNMKFSIKPSYNCVIIKTNSARGVSKQEDAWGTIMAWIPALHGSLGAYPMHQGALSLQDRHSCLLILLFMDNNEVGIKTDSMVMGVAHGQSTRMVYTRL